MATNTKAVKADAAVEYTIQKEDVKYFVKRAEFHVPVRDSGVTEKNLAKFKGLQWAGWTHDGFFAFQAKELHVLPGSAVLDSTV